MHRRLYLGSLMHIGGYATSLKHGEAKKTFIDYVDEFDVSLRLGRQLTSLRQPLGQLAAAASAYEVFVCGGRAEKRIVKICEVYNLCTKRYQHIFAYMLLPMLLS